MKSPVLHRRFFLSSLCVIACSPAVAFESVRMVLDVTDGAPIDSTPQRFASWADGALFSANNLEGNIETYRLDARGQNLSVFQLADPNSIFHSTLALLGGGFLVRSGTAETGVELGFLEPTSGIVTLIKDIEAGPQSSVITSFFAAGDRFYFLASTSATGYQVWQTDGTEAGTYLVGDNTPGINWSLDRLFPLGNRAVLFTNDGVHGTEPWLVDGPNDRVQLIQDIVPGSASSFNNLWVGINAASIGDRVVFVARAGSANQVWSTAGDESSTFQLTSSSYILGVSTQRIFRWNNQGIFDARLSNSLPVQWFLTDGTPNGTQVLALEEPLAGASNVQLFALAGEIAVLANVQGVRELWMTSLAAGTTRRLYSGLNFAGEIKEIGQTSDGRTFFAGELPNEGVELWITDGTPAGTLRLQDIFPGPNSSISDNVRLADGRYTFPSAILNDHLLIAAKSPAYGREPWISDGTAAGTRLVADIVPRHGLSPRNLIAAQNRLYFLGTDAEHGSEFWTSDGTAQGTYLTSDATPGPNGNSLALPAPALIGDTLICRLGSATWRSDGTHVGTYQIMPSAGATTFYESFGGHVYFNAQAGTNHSIWLTDGTLAGTESLLSFSGGINEGYIPQSGALAGKLVLSGPMGIDQTGSELWMFDPAGGALQRISDIYAGAFSSDPRLLTTLGNRVAFAATDASTGRELWITDGTESGTTLVRDIRAGSAGSNPTQLLAFGEKLFFIADDGVSGMEPWVSDGTEFNTQLLVDIYPGSASSLSGGSPFVAAGNLVFFGARGPQGGALWATDGTPVGTYLIREGSAALLAADQGGVYFVSSQYPRGAELWWSDGSTLGTYRLADIQPGPAAGTHGIPNSLCVLNGAAYFSADDGMHGPELWTVRLEASPDSDGDGIVGLQDLAQLLGGFGNCIGDAEYTRTLDLNVDGCITIQDLSILLSAFGS